MTILYPETNYKPKMYTLGLGDLGTVQTVNIMRRLLNDSIKNPVFRGLTEKIISYVPARNEYLEIQAVYQYAGEHIRFTKDIYGIETIKTPERMLTEIREGGQAFGDCDDISLFVSTLLRSIGYRTRFVVITTPQNPLNVYDHIWTQTFIRDKANWINVDPSTDILSFNEVPRYRRIAYYE